MADTETVADSRYYHWVNGELIAVGCPTGWEFLDEEEDYEYETA